ncbi:MAG: hypothetical protein JSV32_04965 [Dehalococcoidia bacterium]|jgi:hypothetical protein|nr:MAG: hypothetical protein JSV32_04965 [Dehalococcoidia bacterium]
MAKKKSKKKKATKKVYKKGLRIVNGGDKLNQQKWVSVHRLRRDGQMIEGFFAVGSRLNKAKRLRSPFIQWHVTQDLDDAIAYANRHKEAWNIPTLKIESILLNGLELSGEVD